MTCIIWENIASENITMLKITFFQWKGVKHWNSIRKKWGFFMTYEIIHWYIQSIKKINTVLISKSNKLKEFNHFKHYLMQLYFLSTFLVFSFFHFFGLFRLISVVCWKTDFATSPKGFMSINGQNSKNKVFISRIWRKWVK